MSLKKEPDLLFLLTGMGGGIGLIIALAAAYFESWIIFSFMILVAFVFFALLLLSLRLSAIPIHFVTFIAIYIPFEGFIVKWFPITLQRYIRYLPELAIMLMFAFVVIHGWHKRRKLWWPRNPVDIPLLIFLFLAFVSAVLNSVPYFVVLAALKNLIRYIPLYYILLFSDVSLEYMKKFTALMIGIAAFQAILALIETVGGAPVAGFLRSNLTSIDILTGATNGSGSFGRSKPSGTVGLYSGYGVFLVFWSVFTFTYYLAFKKRKYLLLSVIMLAAIMISRARTSWILAMLAFFLVLWHIRKHLFVRSVYTSLWIVLVIILLVVGGYLGILLDPQLINRMSLLDNYGAFQYRPESVVQRFTEILTVEYWQKASRVVTLTITLPAILKHYPALGLGPGTMASAVTGGGSTSRGLFPEYSHQTWIEVPEHIVVWAADTGFVAIIAQYGLLGIACWWWIFLSFTVMAWKNYKQATDRFIRGFNLAMMINILLVFFITEFGGHYIVYREVSVYLWIGCAFVVIFRKMMRSDAYTPKTVERIPYLP